MFSREDVLSAGYDIIDQHGDVDTWRVNDFGGTEVFEDYVNWSLDSGYPPRALLSAAVSFGVVLERLRAEQERS